jgi:hypothetical protein
LWLALALLFAIGAILSVTADTFWPAATAETTGPATVVEAPQPVVAARAKPAEPEVPVAMLDDVPPRSAVGTEALARWFVAPGAPPPTRGPRRCSRPCHSLQQRPLAGQPGQDSKAGIKPLEGDARPTRKPKDSNAQLPASGERPTPGHADRQADFRTCCDD